jgi:hypothetical protein
LRSSSASASPRRTAANSASTVSMSWSVTNAIL